MTEMTLYEIDSALMRMPASPKTDADLEARHDLMVKRFEITDAIRKTEMFAMIKRRNSKAWIFPLARVPDDVQCIMLGANAQPINAEIVDGIRMMPLTPDEVRLLSAGNEAWIRLNPELATYR